MKPSKNLVFVIISLILVSFQASSASCLIKESADSIKQTNLAATANTPESLFNRIYQLAGIPTIVLETDMKKLIRNKLKETYQVTGFNLKDDQGTDLFSLQAKVRARGNMRKKVSHFPPLKLDFVKSDLKELGLLKIDDLKLVLPNNSQKQNQQKLFKEYLLYKLYAAIESSAIHVKLVNLSILTDGEEKHQLPSILIEDEADYINRTGAKVLARGKISPSRMDRKAFAKMVFFQNMICNTDFSILNKHNVKIAKIPNREKLIAIPYDFDYSGFVDHSYAVPHDIVPIDNVHERYVFQHCKLSDKEYEETKTFFLSIEQQLYDICDGAAYMDERTIKDSKRYIKTFFDDLRKSKRMKRQFTK